MRVSSLIVRSRFSDVPARVHAVPLLVLHPFLGHPTRLMVNLCRPVHAERRSAIIWDAKARRTLCPTERGSWRIVCNGSTWPSEKITTGRQRQQIGSSRRGNAARLCSSTSTLADGPWEIQLAPAFSSAAVSRNTVGLIAQRIVRERRVLYLSHRLDGSNTPHRAYLVILDAPWRREAGFKTASS
jgi:hypothetical protein